jgi:hypothetical protein
MTGAGARPGPADPIDGLGTSEEYEALFPVVRR